MGQAANAPIAWVESPLQLVAAAEWATTQDEPIVVALRITGPQMSGTAEELLSRGARFARCVPYFGIPWQLLSQHRKWAVGDGFSGQFRLAGTLITPRALTLLDDGAQTLAVADALLGRSPYARPGLHESSAATLLGSLIRDRMLGMAARELLEITTAFNLGAERLAALADRGIRATRHRLEWIRQTARPIAVPGNRILLGSALPIDGRIPFDRYLRWVADEARESPLAYLPHRRETAKTMGAVRELPGVRVYETGLPVELVLAGTQEPLEVLTLPTSAETTLALVLDGTGSTIHTRSLVRSGR
ncbi:hypothetical protein [Glaciihabitans sp. UYNi722]|uniref:hypothetical protein n=1 Tax=Glaciihabitans sp. UYNi722 TaxID=3156344 RepID=UPI003392BDFC